MTTGFLIFTQSADQCSTLPNAEDRFSSLPHQFLAQLATPKAPGSAPPLHFGLGRIPNFGPRAPRLNKQFFTLFRLVAPGPSV